MTRWNAVHHGLAQSTSSPSVRQSVSAYVQHGPVPSVTIASCQIETFIFYAKTRGHVNRKQEIEVRITNEAGETDYRLDI